MTKTSLKVTVIRGKEQEFEQFCKKQNISHKAYNSPSLKHLYSVNCKKEELNGAKDFIQKIEDMPMIVLDFNF